jgi:predicted RNA-binding protein with PIN domain
MMKTILVDGYNLIFHFPEIRKRMEMDLESARDELVRLLRMVVNEKQEKMVVVFDGDDRAVCPSKQVGCIQVIFSRKPEGADPLIKRYIEREHDSVSLVVSSDAEIVSYAKLYGVRTSTSKQYAYHVHQALSPDIEKQVEESMNEDEIDEWMRLFRDREQSASD